MPTDTNSPGDKPPQKPRRKGVTIDLAAKEVARAKAAEAEPSPSSGGAGDATTPTTGAEAAPAPEGGAAGAADPEPVAPNAVPDPPESAPDNASMPPFAPRSAHEPQRPAASQSASGFLPLVAAAIAGGVVVAILIAALIKAGVLAPGGSDLSVDVAALRGEMAKLQQAASDNSAAPLQGEIAALKQSVADLGGRPPPADNSAALQTLETRLASLEDAAKNGAGAADPALVQQVSALAADVAVLKTSGVVPADVESSIGAVRDSVTGLSARVDSLPSAERMTAIEAKMDALSEKIDTAAALAPAVAAEALEASLDAGQPFATELDALKSLGVESEAIDGLAPFAGSGLPTLAALRTSFDAAIATVDLSTPVAEETSAIDRLLQSARGLVEVRPAHPTAGDDPAAIVARIKGDLADGDLPAALAEWASLPDPVKAATADWQKRAEARSRADSLVTDLRADALSHLKPAE